MRVGITSQFSFLRNPEIELCTGDDRQLTSWLDRGEVDAGLLWSTEYGRKWEDYLILPGLEIPLAKGEYFVSSSLMPGRLTSRDVGYTGECEGMIEVLQVLLAHHWLVPDAGQTSSPEVFLGKEDAGDIWSVDLAGAWAVFCENCMIQKVWVVRRQAAERFPGEVAALFQWLETKLGRKGDAVNYRERTEVKGLLYFFAHASILGLLPPKVSLRFWGTWEDKVSQVPSNPGSVLYF